MGEIAADRQQTLSANGSMDGQVDAWIDGWMDDRNALAAHPIRPLHHTVERCKNIGSDQS